MLNNSRNLKQIASRLASKQFKNLKDCPPTSVRHVARAAATSLPIPQNIDVSESTRFSPHRNRDISASVIVSQYNDQMAQPQQEAETEGAPVAFAGIDITTDNTKKPEYSSFGRNPYDPHIQHYDCSGPISLNAVMQSNVPSPFGGMHKFTHLNMPGGQWSQEGKFMSQNLQSSHYTALRQEFRAIESSSYDKNITLKTKVNATFASPTKRTYCTKAKPPGEATTTPNACSKATAPASTAEVPTLSKKEQLKRAFKDYGATVVVFHVAISLLSLGGCYALVSGGIDMMPVLEYLGLGSTTLSQKVASGASTFVVAYAIHKVFAPVRVSLTLGATPFIVRYLRTKGLIKAKIIKQK